ncbi:hypothetical protein C7N43_22750 [Sphingobacteriales bacterium UPWRP_1]|nr:hypothetical protein C7N43_22750 [Sphingobacteriales bacterium UPWRP_1]
MGERTPQFYLLRLINNRCYTPKTNRPNTFVKTGNTCALKCRNSSNYHVKQAFFLKSMHNFNQKVFFS